MAVPIARSCMDSQVLSHALLGALLAEVNGANAAGGALAGAGGELAAQVLTQALYEGANPDDLGEGQRQIISSLSSLVGALAGGIVGGDRGTVFNAAVGGNVATNAVENNRLLSLQELDVIARLTAEGYSEEELRAVACAMVQCLLGRGLMEPGTMAEGLGGHFYLTEAGEQLANEYQAVLGSMSAEEISAISSRLAGTGMFGYSRTDAWRDAVRDTGFMTRLDGLGQATTGTLGSLGISAFCTLTGGIGCAAGGTAAAAEASDNITAGLAAFYTGRPTLALQNQVWQGLGLSPEQANLAEGFTGLVIAGGGAHATNRALSGDATTLDTVTVNGTKPEGASPAGGGSSLGTADNLLPEANFIGQIPTRADLQSHLVNAQVSGKQISGGHNMANFESTLQGANGKIVSKKEIAPGIYEIEYQLPKGEGKTPERKTVYDPSIYSDAQMSSMASVAAVRAQVQFQMTGDPAQYVKVGSVWFYAPINVDKATGRVNGIRTICPSFPPGGG